MPSYKVIEKGFYGGRIYDPNGKRNVLHTDKPFPKKNNKEQIPSWLKLIKQENCSIFIAAQNNCQDKFECLLTWLMELDTI